MNLYLDVIVTENRVVNAAMPTVENITRMIRGPYTLTSNAMGGHTAAQFQLSCNIRKAWNILTNHIGRRIVVKSALSPFASGSVWEGTITTIKIDDGRTSIQRSIEAVYNMIYIQDLTTGTPPTMAQDSTSQGLYGIRELAITASPKTSTEAAQIRGALLAFHKMPTPTQQGSRMAAGGSFPEVAVTITCAGIWEAYGRRNYRALTNGTRTLTSFITDILSTRTQFASSDRTHIETNTTTKAKKVGSYVTCQTLIGQICSMGGPDYRRWYFGFYEDGVPYFHPEPTTVSYIARTIDRSEGIYDATTGARVPPFLVRPGRIIQIVDVMPDSITWPNTALGDPRKMVIGEVKFTAPGGVEMSPQITNPGQVRMDQLIGRQ